MAKFLPSSFPVLNACELAGQEHALICRELLGSFSQHFSEGASMYEETVAKKKKKANQKPTNNKFPVKEHQGCITGTFRHFNVNLLIINRYVIPWEGGACLHQLGLLKVKDFMELLLS